MVALGRGVDSGEVLSYYGEVWSGLRGSGVCNSGGSVAALGRSGGKLILGKCSRITGKCIVSFAGKWRISGGSILRLQGEVQRDSGEVVVSGDVGLG